MQFLNAQNSSGDLYGILTKDIKRLNCDEVKEFLKSMASINVEKISQRNSFPKFIGFWTYSISRFVNMFDISFNDDEILYYITILSRSSVILYNRCSESDLIQCWVNPEMKFQYSEPPTGLIFKPIYMRPLKLVDFARKLFAAPYYNKTEVILWSLNNAIREFHIPNDFIFDLVTRNKYFESKVNAKDILNEVLNFDNSLNYKETYNDQSINYLCENYLYDSIGKLNANYFQDHQYYNKLLHSNAQISTLLISACYVQGSQITSPKLLKDGKLESIIIVALKNGLTIRYKDIPQKPLTTRLAILLAMSSRDDQCEKEIFQMLNQNSPELEPYLSIIASSNTIIANENLIVWANRGNPEALIALSKDPKSWEEITNQKYLTIIKALTQQSSPKDDITIATAVRLLNGGSSVAVFNKAYDSIISKTSDIDFAFFETASMTKNIKKLSLKDILRIEDNEICIACVCAVLCQDSLVTDEEKAKLAELSLLSSVPFKITSFVNFSPLKELAEKAWKKHLYAALNDVRNFATKLNSDYKTTAAEALNILIAEEKYDKIPLITKVCGESLLVKMPHESIGKYFSYLFTNQVDKCTAFLRNFTSNVPIMEQCYKVIASNLQNNSDFIDTIYQDIPKTENFAKIILENINLSGKVSSSTLHFLSKVLSLLQVTHPLKDSVSIKSIRTDWDEPKENTQSGTLWDYPADVKDLNCTYIESGPEYVEQPWFHCHTCKLTGQCGVCVNCALTCHKDHDLEYHKPTKFFCDCWGSGHCQHNKEMIETHMEDNENDNENENEENQLEDVSPEIIREIIQNGDEIPQEMLEALRRSNALRTTNIDLNNDNEQYQEPRRTAWGYTGISTLGNTRRGLFGSGGGPGGTGGLHVIGGTWRESRIAALAKPKQIAPTAASLLQMMKWMDEVEISESNALQNRLSVPIEKADIKSLTVAKEIPKLSLSASHLQVLPIRPEKGFSGSMIFGGFGFRRMENFSASPTMSQIVTVPGGLMVSDGSMVKVVSNMKFIADFRLPSRITGLCACDLDPSIVAVASNDNVFILSFDGQTIKQTHVVQYMYEGETTVINIEWVPMMPMLLAVTTSRFVKIFNIPDDCVSPKICLMPHEKPISSCTFCIINDIPTAFISSTDGETAKITITEDLRGPQNFNFPQSSMLEALMLSNSISSDLMFTSGKDFILISRPSDSENCVKLPIPGCRMATFCAAIPNHENILLFRDRNAIFAVEVADDKIYVSSIQDTVSGIAVDGDTIIAVMSDGKIATLGEGAPKVIVKPEMPEMPAESYPEERVKVPATFWINSKESQYEPTISRQEDFLDRAPGGEGSQIRVSVTPVNVTLRATEGTKVVGFQVKKASSNGVIIIIGERKVTITDRIPRTHMIALKPQEAASTVTISVRSDREICVVSFTTFCSELQDMGTADDSTSVSRRSVVPSSDSTCSQAIIAEMCACALPPHQKAPKFLFELAYKSQKVSTAAQIALSKCDTTKEDFTEAEKEALQSGTQPNARLWRDIAISCIEGDVDVPPSIWDGQKTVHSLFVAFMTK